MALLPFISTLTVTVNLDGHFGADLGADGAAGAFPVIGAGGRQVTGRVQTRGHGDDVFGTESDAELAALAAFPVDFDAAFHNVIIIQ
jgi:hypothetical protein